MVWQYAIPIGMSLFGAWNRNRQKKKQAEAENRARLNQFYDASNAYVANNILKDTSWKDAVIQQEIQADEAFDQAAESWRQQDMQLEQQYATHAFNVVDLLVERYRKEYAGEQTGVTASRLAAEPIRQAGFAITKSVRNVIMAQDTAILNKEIVANNADRARAAYYEQIRQSPIRTPPPRVPDLVEGPSSGEFWTDFAIGAALGVAGAKIGGISSTSKWGAYKPALLGAVGGAQQMHQAAFSPTPISAYQAGSGPVGYVSPSYGGSGGGGRGSGVNLASGVSPFAPGVPVNTVGGVQATTSAMNRMNDFLVGMNYLYSGDESTLLWNTSNRLSLNVT